MCLLYRVKVKFQYKALSFRIFEPKILYKAHLWYRGTLTNAVMWKWLVTKNNYIKKKMEALLFTVHCSSFCLWHLPGQAVVVDKYSCRLCSLYCYGAKYWDNLHAFHAASTIAMMLLTGLIENKIDVLSLLISICIQVILLSLKQVLPRWFLANRDLKCLLVRTPCHVLTGEQNLESQTPG